MTQQAVPPTNTIEQIKKNQQSRQVILVTGADRKLGYTDVVRAHQGEGLLHRAITIFLFRNVTGKAAGTEVLIQQRSQYKVVGAHKWATSACGNVRPDENRKNCALNRLRDELGVVGIPLKPVSRFPYHVATEEGYAEHELLTVYAGWGNVSVTTDPEEVKAYKWENWQHLQHLLKPLSASDYTSDWAIWLIYLLRQPALVQSLNKYIAKRIAT